VTQYSYDPDGRLGTVTYADQTQDSFSYDNNGNRLSSRSHGQLFTT
jgi:YD repeat-containing protein